MNLFHVCARARRVGIGVGAVSAVLAISRDIPGGSVSLGHSPEPIIVAEWTFEDGLQGWTPNSHVTNVAVRDGRLHCHTIGPDPMFILRHLELPAHPWHAVVIRLKADRPGPGELFWTGSTTGRYGGFEPNQSARFEVEVSGADSDIVVIPFWQNVQVIRQLRLDLFDGASFEVDFIRILDWSRGLPPITNVFEWSGANAWNGWWRDPVHGDLYSPPLDVDIRGREWANIEIEAAAEGRATLAWSGAGWARRQSFSLRPGRHTYYVPLTAGRRETRLAVLALWLSKDGASKVRSLRLAAEPLGPPDLALEYFGLEDPLPRAGRPFTVLARVRNLGGQRSTETLARLVRPAQVALHGPTPQADAQIPALEYLEDAELRWTLQASEPGEVPLTLVLPGVATATVHVVLTVVPPVPVRADGVPPPQRVPTDIEVCAYYFPGWDSDAKWECIRNIAPIRKPLLGYYDEGNPECVDWQIKWAVENGISTFLVDWYWEAGARWLEHWFEAYRAARYRDHLKVAIMWANHNEPGTHSVDDWRAVTRYWMQRYFSLPTYQRLNGKPAVYLWDPKRLRDDVRGSETVRALLAESDAMARAAGYGGITFVALNVPFTPSEIARCAAEGFTAVTSYHEWGDRVRTGWLGGRPRLHYEQVLEDAPAAWAHHRTVATPLLYLPVVDTGWDSRPWHGDKAKVIEGRTPRRFRQLLEAARTFAKTHGLPVVILGPLNEWGEGSYIEPNLEFGFDMYEAVRAVFGRGVPSEWPRNYGPRDVGLGPYDFPPRPPVHAWTFDEPSPDWKPQKGIADVEVSAGALRFRAMTRDPAWLIHTRGLRARDFTRARGVMSVAGSGSATAHGQVFWQTDGMAIGEHASVHFELPADGQLHEVLIPLARHPWWRGRITALRLDPCAEAGARVVIEEFELLP